MTKGQPSGPRRTSSFGKSMKAVFWSFFGVRKRRDYEDDAANLSPFHVIIAAFIGLAIFIGVLVLLVRLAVSQ